MFGLEPDTLRNIKEAIAKIPAITKVILYGSRAKGNYRKGSDIDITLLGKNLTLKNSVYPLMDEFEELYLPYTFDISIFRHIDNDDLIKHIGRVGKVFYRSNRGLPSGWQVKKLGDVCNLIEKEGTGATVKGVKLPFVKGLQIPLPPLHEQKRIVTILDEAFSGINKAITNAENNLANARELFESYLNNVFTLKGEGWEEKKFGEICTIKHGFAFKSKFFAPEGDYVVLTPGSFFESGGFRDQGTKTKYYLGEIPSGFILDEGDFLIAMTEQAAGLLGSSLIVPDSNRFLHNQRLGLVKVNDGIHWNNDFFHHQLNTRYFRDAVQITASGVKVRHTSPKKLAEIPICFPVEVSEQERIADVLNEIRTQVNKLETIYQQKLKALKELKQSILQKAFSGELTTDTTQ